MRPGKKTGKKPAPKQQSMGCCGLIMWLLKWGTICFGLFLVMLYCGVFTRMGALKWVETHANEDGNLHLLVGLLVVGCFYSLFLFIYYFILFFIKWGDVCMIILY